MDLKALHSTMSKMCYHYMKGNTNNRDNNLYISFSTLYNGRGDTIEFRIGEIDNDINEHKNISDKEVFSILKSILVEK